MIEKPRYLQRSVCSFATWTFAAMVLVFCHVGPVQAQLAPETKDLFENIKSEFDSDLRDKLQEAIDKNRAWIDLTPDQLVRFRSNPINPFDGLHDIDPYSEPGNIRIEFKLPSIRDRVPAKNERQHADTLNGVTSITQSVRTSTVSLLSDGTKVALGTIVTAQGLILTKASELDDQPNLICRLTDGREFKPQILQKNEAYDLAFLKIDASGLTPVRLANSAVVPGTFVVTPSDQGKPLSLGVCSLACRSLPNTNQAFLGVRPEESDNGVRLVEVTHGGSAHAAGLLPGDVVEEIGGSKIQSVTDLVNAIRSHQPNDVVAIVYRRSDQRFKIKSKLTGQSFRDDPAVRFNMMNQFGTIPSRRGENFPWVLQHDTPLLPEQCGGPLVDLDGNVVGINIARAGRVSSYAIPSNRVQEIVDQMLRENVASRKNEKH